MSKRTPFYNAHQKANAHMVDFAGWEMPLHYGSQLQEHHQVRRAAGIFDVSHMGIVDITGVDALHYLRFLLANNVDKLLPGKALYTCMLNDNAGVIDDLIVYKFKDDHFRVIVNAGTRDKDLAWMRDKANTFNVEITDRNDLAMLAIQGPQIKEKLPLLFPSALFEQAQTLKPFNFCSYESDGLIARTGYTGEDGYEIIFPKENANTLWDACLKAGILPCGLGARDTLRLEAGLNLYGTDMDENVTPLESNLAWTVALEPSERQFIGRAALEAQVQSGVKRKLIGLVLLGKGVMRNHQKVSVGESSGEVTSGGFSPTLNKSIGLARVPSNFQESGSVEIRGKKIPVQFVKPPFVRFGKQMFKDGDHHE